MRYLGDQVGREPGVVEAPGIECRHRTGQLRRMQYARTATSTGDTALGLEPVPPLDEICEDPQFELVEIGKEEFEALWAESQRPALG